MMQQVLDRQFTVGWSIEKGRRRTNEDSVAAINLDLISGDTVRTLGIFAVADGMGGGDHGEIASRVAVNSTIRGLIEQLTDMQEDTAKVYLQGLERAVQVANQIVYSQNSEIDSEMGTTLVVALVVGNQVYIANVGDSRAYLLTNIGITRITQDHTLAAALVRQGTISAAQARNHPFRNILSQGIGLSKSLEVDTFRREFEDDGYLLLCSDGLTAELKDAQIHNIVLSARSPQHACDLLAEAANRAGGRDNISVILIHLRRS